MSLIGTFIVRSGLITSVHAFASDPERGIFMLTYIGVVTGTGLALFARCTPQLSSPPALLSRSGFILINNMLLVCAAATVLLAILYPVFLTLLNLPAISVGPPYFNATFIPMMAPLVLLAALAPLLPWDKPSRTAISQAFMPLLPLTLGITLFLFMWIDLQHSLAVVGAGMSFWLVAGTIVYAKKCWKAIPHAPGVSKLKRLPLRSVAGILGHLGLALLVLGIALTAAFKTSFEQPIRAGETLHLGAYRVQVHAIEKTSRENFIAQTAYITLIKQGKTLAALAPETRFYPVRGEETAESSVRTLWWGDIYAVIGRTTLKAPNQSTIVGLKIYIVPGQHAIWLGFALVALAGFLSAAASWRGRGMHAP
jgi:cytochrome c-type biogenesis protein CcmF